MRASFSIPSALLLCAAVLAVRASGAEMSAAAAREEIARLRRDIARHDQLYFREAAPEIDDAAYDRLRRSLAALEQTFPAEAKRVAALPAITDDRAPGFKSQRHRAPMLSLEKVYADAELRAFHSRIGKQLGREDFTLLIEPKFDGVAVSVTYERGVLVRALTRGNGVEGDDITANARQIRGLPHRLGSTADFPWPDLIELRGEIYVPYAAFERVNAERELAGEARFANPRNLAAGTIRQSDGGEVSRRGLEIVFFGVGSCEPQTAAPTSQRALHAAILAWGLPGIASILPARTADELVAAVQRFNPATGSFAFPTDGAVVKVDSADDQRRLGTSDTAPRWAVAYKFAPPRAETQLRAITFQVGRTGVLTPVAELAPVRIGGSVVARATLHNLDEIARKDVRVGDCVYVEKAGEIIPAIVGVNLERRGADVTPFVAPTECPECKKPVLRVDDEAALRCTNADCPAQLKRRLEHFASRACVNIEGLGPATIEALVTNRWVKTIPDLYRLKRSDLLTLPKHNERAVDRLLAAIEQSKRAELWRIIHGLGIPQVGAAMAKDLARQCGSLDALAESGTAVCAGLADPRYRQLITELLAAGVGSSAEERGSLPLGGKTFVLTGTLASLTRAEATAKIEAAGGKVASAVTRTTDFVVVGTDAGAKLTRARELGIAELDEAALLALLRSR